MADTERTSPEALLSSSAGLILRQEVPCNLETPVAELRSFVTPNDRFYVRNHFAAPRLDIGGFRLTIDGAVRNPLALGYDAVRAMPCTTRLATIECAGNSRSFLDRRAAGVQWSLGAVGTAEWTGVSLAHLLAEAGLMDEACDIVVEGADRGLVGGEPAPRQPIAYARSLPRGKALAPEVLVAYQMNGRDLPLDHGYPLRLVVPGHYGMASVKWLTRIHAVNQPFQGYWQTTDYAYWDLQAGHPVRRPLGTMKPKSIIIEPALHEAVVAGRICRITGSAWTGESSVVQVLVSTDGGRTWREASFIDPAQPYVWRRWALDWQVPEAPGPAILMSRAVDDRGETQPDEHDGARFGSYVINHCLKHEVVIATPQNSGDQ
ncbi:sulfite oxidase [Rhodoligotrophos defluvii]|uniref:sulfite oxidase n=1 Tax=Rhodoligotrophos defluvii TaxID=2561934 RepID=UPI0010C9C3E4|nr:sulfite oxidase [Rhodoligotrophos defluvii]